MKIRFLAPLCLRQNLLLLYDFILLTPHPSLPFSLSKLMKLFRSEKKNKVFEVERIFLVLPLLFLSILHCLSFSFFFLSFYRMNLWSVSHTKLHTLCTKFYIFVALSMFIQSPESNRATDATSVWYV